MISQAVIQSSNREELVEETDLRLENRQLKERVAWFEKQLFGSKSEKRHVAPPEQTSLGSPNSEWERHPPGDEIVMVLEGETTLILLEEPSTQAAPTSPTTPAPQLITNAEFTEKRRDVSCARKYAWHRFETPDGVKIMSVTPAGPIV